MFNRIFILILFAISFLNAEPSIAQVKQAVAQNPSLLQSQQAQAMMKEKGVTVEQVQQKLNETTTRTVEKSTAETIENDIEISDSEVAEQNSDIATDIKESKLAKRINPFSYRSNENLRAELNLKQQVLTSKKLTRYSMSFYANRNKIDSASLPTPDNYIISTGDSLDVHVYGDREKNYILDVRNDGSVDLAFIGPVKLGGMTFKEAKEHLEHKLKAHYKMSYFNIKMSKYSTIQVTLVGEVKFPGIYNLSSFSTAKDLLIAAKGVRDSASVRNIIIKRNAKIIATLDFYDLLFKGNKFGTTLLKHGDIVVITKAKKLVSIDGYVNKASIFELNDKENLDKLLEYAGGMRPNASRFNIKIDRYSDNSKFETFKVAYKNAKNFKMQNGDKVYIYPLDFMAKSSINVYGNIIRPGSYRLNKKRTLNEFFRISLQNGMKEFFLPQTYFKYGVIKRYSDTLSYETQSFNLSDVINGDEIVNLAPNDKVYIFSQNDIYSNSYITTKGSSLIKSGKLQYFEGMTITDALNASGIDGFLDDKVRLTTYNTADFMPKTIFYSLKNQSDIKLSAYDEIEVYDYYEKNILEPVSIKGEVIRPATIFYEKGMTLEDLLEVSGGFTRMAYKNRVEIVRYFIDENSTRQKEVINIDLREKGLADIKLEAYDDITIFKIPNWNDKQTVVLAGEVVFPGAYVIDNGEKLSSLIQRAGGYTENAFIEGAIFTRESIKNNQIKQYNQSIAKIKRELTIYNAMPANSKESNSMPQINSAFDAIVIEAKKYEPIGRVSITLDANSTKFENSEYNLVLKDKDSIVIPTRIDTITVFGEVFNPTSFVFNSEYTLSDYIELASGYARSADQDNVYVIHADGRSEPISSGWFSMEMTLQKGDTIVVPIYIKENNTLDIWDSVAKILASFALTAAAINSLGII